MTLSISFGATSRTGAMFILIPIFASSVAVFRASLAASSGSRIWDAPGKPEKCGGRNRATDPPSWSTAMNNGGCPHSKA